MTIETNQGENSEALHEQLISGLVKNNDLTRPRFKAAAPVAFVHVHGLRAHKNCQEAPP
jgi:hypothetical protein